MSEHDKFDVWCVVEVFGHQKYAGRVTEQAIGGASFIRVDVPAVNGQLAFTKLFGQNSIYAITPCSEAAARNVAANCHSRPMEIYSPSIQRPLLASDEDDDHGYDDFNPR